MAENTATWIDAYPLVKKDWYDCSVGFACICGQTALQVIDEPVTCDVCGRVYRLVVHFEVCEVKDG